MKRKDMQDIKVLIKAGLLPCFVLCSKVKILMDAGPPAAPPLPKYIPEPELEPLMCTRTKALLTLSPLIGSDTVVEAIGCQSQQVKREQEADPSHTLSMNSKSQLGNKPA